MGILTACMSFYHVNVWCLQMLEECVGSPGTVVTDDYKLSCKRVVKTIRH